MSAERDSCEAPGADVLEVRDGCFVRDAAFWMVWTKGGSASSHVHHTRFLAEREAKRLARKVPGRKFFVMAATEKFWVQGDHYPAGDRSWPASRMIP